MYLGYCYSLYNEWLYMLFKCNTNPLHDLKQYYLLEHAETKKGNFSIKILILGKKFFLNKIKKSVKNSKVL